MGSTSRPPQGGLGCFSPLVILIAFTMTNIINYMDRGIVPGAPEEVGEFAMHSTGSTNQDTLIGSLYSAFIGGYAVASLVFGHLVHLYPPFKLVGIGLAIWVVAIVASGAAPSYYFLLAARVLSGVGEASFYCVVPTYIDDNAPPAQRSLYLAIFYMAIPGGTAVGYGWGAAISSALSWRWAFYLEAPLMLPFVILCFMFPDPPKHEHPAFLDERQAGADEAEKGGLLAGGADGEGKGAPSSSLGSESEQSLLSASYGAPIDGADYAGPDAPTSGPPRPPTVVEELMGVLSSPEYVFVVLGYAAYTFVVAGLGNFGPTFVIGLGLFEDETTASLLFGAIIAVVGFSGTLIGGLVIDCLQARNSKAYEERIGIDSSSAGDESGQGEGRRSAEMVSVGGSAASLGQDQTLGPETGFDQNGEYLVPSDRYSSPRDGGSDSDDAVTLRSLDLKLISTTPLTFGSTLVGFVLCLLSPFFAASRGGFLSVLGLGALCLFINTAAVNLAILASVPPESRPFAVGLGTVVLHALGDVPSPVIIGQVADQLAPGTTKDRSHRGLQITMVLTTMWLLWALLFWGGAWFLASRRMARHERGKDYKELGGRDTDGLLADYKDGGGWYRYLGIRWCCCSQPDSAAKASVSG